MPNKLVSDSLYTNVLDLDKLDVFMDGSGTEPMYIEIRELPDVLTYGKHYGIISFKDLENSPYRLRDGSQIQFEIKDVNGTVIFSDLAVSQESKNSYSGASIFYVWLKESPLYTNETIENGMGTLTVVGELEGVPAQWQFIPNYRCTFPIEIRKDLPNTSPILFQSSSLVQGSISFTETIEADTDSSADKFERSYINVSASNLHTFGGKVDRIELSYREARSIDTEYKVLTTYPITSSVYEISSSTTVAVSESRTSFTPPKGLGPISDLQKVIAPTDIRRSGDIDLRLRFINPAGLYAQDINQEREIQITGSISSFNGSRVNIDTADGIFVTGSGNILFGPAQGSGMRLYLTGSAIEIAEFHKGSKLKTQQRWDPKGAAGAGNTITDPDKNFARGETTGSAILGGIDVTIQDSPYSSVTAGSASILIQDSPSSAIIASAYSQIVQHNTDNPINGRNVIISADNSWISQSAVYDDTDDSPFNNFLAAGEVLHMHMTRHSALIGGQLNTMSSSRYSVLIGGSQNTVGPDTNNNNSVLYGGIIGGQNNTVTHDHSIVIGGYNVESLKPRQVHVENLHIKTAMTASGNVRIEGKLFTEEFHTTHTSSSIIFRSGSTQFGDSGDDTHIFTGSLKVNAGGSSTDIVLEAGDDLTISADDNVYINAHDHIYLNPGDDGGTGAVYNQTGYYAGDGTTTDSMFIDSDVIQFYAGSDAVAGPEFKIDGNVILSNPMGKAGGDFRHTGDTLNRYNIFSDAGSETVGINQTGTGNPPKTLTVTGEISSSGDITTQGNISASSFHLTSSGAVVVHQGASGENLSKWEFTRDGIRKFVMYNDGRTNAVVPQDSFVFKHGTADDGDDHINFSIKQDDQTVYFHGDISASGDFYSNNTVHFNQSISSSGTIYSEDLEVKDFIGFQYTEGDKGAILDLAGLKQSSWGTFFSDLDEDENNITMESADPTIRIVGAGSPRTPKIDICRHSKLFSGAENYTDYRLLSSGGHFYFQSKRQNFNSGATTNVWTVNETNQAILIGSGSDNIQLASDDLPNYSLEVIGNISSSASSTGSFGYLQVGTSLLGSDAKVTVEGNISASGNIEGDAIRSNGAKVARYREDIDTIRFGRHQTPAMVTGSFLRFGDDSGFHVTASGNISQSNSTSTGSFGGIHVRNRVGIGTHQPDYDLDVAGTVGVANYIYHNGDEDTHILMEADMINLVAGGKSGIKIDQDEGWIRLNNTNANLDTQIMGDNGLVVFHLDAGTNRVGISSSAPPKTLTVGGEISSSGKLWAQGADFGDFDIDNVQTITLDRIAADNGGAVIDFSNAIEGNLGEGDIDFIYYDNTETALLHVDAALSRVGISDTSPVSKLDVGGDLNVQSHITASGNISASGDVNAQSGSFGGAVPTSGKTLTVEGDISASGGIFLGENQQINFKGVTSADYLKYNGSDLFYKGTIANQGAYGVGRTSSGDQKLTVEGEISSSEAIFAKGTDLDFTVSASANTQIIIDGDVSSSGDWYGSGAGIRVSGSTEEITLLTVTHPETGSLMEVKATQDSGSLVLSGSLLLKNNSPIPAVSESRLYNNDGTLYWGGNAHVSQHPIAPKRRVYYHHNFYDDIGTSTVYVPWTTGLEGGTPLGSAAQLFISDATLLKVFFTVDDVSGDATVTMGLTYRAPASDSNVAVATKTFDIDTNSDRDVIMVDWSGTAAIPAGSLVGIYLDSSADVGGNEWYNLTSVWEIDMSTELTGSITS